MKSGRELWVDGFAPAALSLSGFGEGGVDPEENFELRLEIQELRRETALDLALIGLVVVAVGVVVVFIVGCLGGVSVGPFPCLEFCRWGTDSGFRVGEAVSRANFCSEGLLVVCGFGVLAVDVAGSALLPVVEEVDLVRTMPSADYIMQLATL